MDLPLSRGWRRPLHRIPNHLQPSWATADLEGCELCLHKPHTQFPQISRGLCWTQTPVQPQEAGPQPHTPGPGLGTQLWKATGVPSSYLLPALAWPARACVLPVCGDSGPTVEGEQCQKAGGPGSSPNPAPSGAPRVSQFSSWSASPKKTTENKLPPTLGAPAAGPPTARLWAGPDTLPRCLNGSRR